MFLDLHFVLYISNQNERELILNTEMLDLVEFSSILQIIVECAAVSGKYWHRFVFLIRRYFAGNQDCQCIQEWLVMQNLLLVLGWQVVWEYYELRKLVVQVSAILGFLRPDDVVDTFHTVRNLVSKVDQC